MSYINSYRNYSGFGEPQPQPQPRPPLLDPGPQLQMPPFETIMGYRPGSSALSGPQLDRVRRVADFVLNSWRGLGAITQIRIAGYVDIRESQPDLAQLRANAVRDALVEALHQQSPGLATRIFWMTEDRGVSQYAKVEIYVWAGPTPMPVPPLNRLPSAPAPNGGPETPEQRINRILQTLPPTIPRRKYSQAFWQKLDEQLNSTMSRFRVPQSLRSKIRDGVHAAISRGTEALIDQILDAADLSGDVKNAVKSTARAAFESPMR